MTAPAPTPSQTKPLHLRLPATSANLGPGFDALGLAMALYLTIDATVSECFTINATGRNADLCAQLDRNLILTTYMDVLANVGVLAPRLHLQIHNEIPIGMGCGSSAAALLAGVLLANHFGNLDWTSQQILEEACRREGHPDNVAACFLGGMTASAMRQRISYYSNMRTRPKLELAVSLALRESLYSQGARPPSRHLLSGGRRREHSMRRSSCRRLLPGTRRSPPHRYAGSHPSALSPESLSASASASALGGKPRHSWGFP